MPHRYKMTSTGASSAKYGLCEVCHQSVSLVFHQIEERSYTIPADKLPTFEEAVGDHEFVLQGKFSGWTTQGCHNLFGHAECLISRRKEQG